MFRVAASLLSFVTVFGLSALSLGQPTPAPTEARTPGAESAEFPTEVGGPFELPDFPDVADPMLEPVPPASRRLSTWREALRLVRAKSPTLRISQAQVAQAEGLARQALASALPQVTGNASVNRHLLFGIGVNFGAEGVQQNATIPDPATTLNASLDVRQPVIALSAWYAAGTANRRTRAADLSAQDTERLLFGTVAESAVAVITAERVAEVSRVSLRFALSTVELTERRRRLGAANKIDVLRAEQEVALARSQVVAADESLRRTRETLGLAVGDDEAWGVGQGVSVPELAATAKALCRTLPDLSARSDVQAASANAEIAERGKQSVDYLYAPTFDLTSNLNYTNNINRSPNGEHVTWTVGALLTWPIYDGGNREGERIRAEAEAAIAREQLTDVKRNATLQIIQARRAVTVARANVEVTQRSRDIAAEGVRLSRIAFVNGTGTSFDLVDNTRRMRESEIDLAIQEFDLIRAEIAALLAQSNCRI